MAGAAPPPPGAGAGGFPSPSITAHPHLGMEAIEDMLLEGHEATSSPTAALARTLDTASDNSGGGKRAPTVPGTKAASSAIAKDTSYPTTNAVHMQLQENAKLPTFNLPVDRSNASWKTPTPRGRRPQRPGRRGGRHRSMSSCSGDSGSMSSGYPYAAQAQARARQLAAHAKTKASIAHATVQRSKFGFGGDHRVPGVPAPPPSVSGRSAGAPGAAPPATSVSDDANLPEKVGNVIAYERKKQRAKDARVKLNDAIEELAVAIDLAGSQSKERFNYVSKTTGTNSGHITHGQPPSGPPQHPLARLMDETIQQASDAKKWDRPTFVGLAANVIHSLNAQCEGLMREVAQLRKVAIANGTAADFSELQYNPSGAPVPGQAAKRQKLGPGKARQQFHAATLSPSGASQVLKDQQTRLIIRLALETPNVLKNAASYLDARSLSRSLCVSKRWRIQNIFQNPNLWLDLCVKRFGASATRKWQEADENQHRTNAVLYRAMSEKNVQPYCPKEGTLALGGASLDGLVSCWVSLMDRSNGETYRSVRQIKTQGGETRESYGSLPVVELRLLVQNTGHAEGAIIIPDQEFCVDASTRRKGEKMLEVNSDDRFKRQVLHIERRPSIDGKPVSEQDKPLTNELCHLGLFECAVISVHVHARACSTTTKFCQRSKRTQLLVSIDGTTRPIPIPFHCTNEHPLKPNFH
ncbi:hypothetical protein ACHAXT_004772 [Thalassiosira profunda]